jgi:hypothetical protein
MNEQEPLVPISSVQLREKEEHIKALQMLVKDYDNYLHDLMPHAYTYYSKPFQLRKRAREEGVQIEEPQP